MQTDANHKLTCSLRVAVSRHLDRRVRLEAALVKRRSVSEFVRTVLEEKLDALDRARSIP